MESSSYRPIDRCAVCIDMTMIHIFVIIECTESSVHECVESTPCIMIDVKRLLSLVTNKNRNLRPKKENPFFCWCSWTCIQNRNIINEKKEEDYLSIDERNECTWRKSVHGLWGETWWVLLICMLHFSTQNHHFKRMDEEQPEE